MLQKTGHSDENKSQKVASSSLARSADRLFATHYEELFNLARRLLRRGPRSNTLMTGDLLHESFMRLRSGGPWGDDRHFLLSVACAMRHVIIDRARARFSAKRDGSLTVSLDEDAMPGDFQHFSRLEDVLEIARLLSELEAQDPRLVRVIDCRFFAGYSQVETADILGIDERTVRRDWNRARAWLLVRMTPQQV